MEPNHAETEVSLESLLIEIQANQGISYAEGKPRPKDRIAERCPHHVPGHPQRAPGSEGNAEGSGESPQNGNERYQARY